MYVLGVAKRSRGAGGRATVGRVMDNDIRPLLDVSNGLLKLLVNIIDEGLGEPQ